MAARRGGCAFPILLIVFIGLVLTFDGEDEPRPLSPERPAFPEAPLPEDPPVIPRDGEHYGIDDPGPPRDSQGTAFALSRDGLWMTADHVVKGCSILGLATAADRAERSERVIESAVSDAALIADGLPSRAALTLSGEPPVVEADGYHMGFPSGQAAVVHSRFIGQANAIRASGANQPILAWAEIERFPAFDHSLGGISGGPTFDARGRVVGINSASSERRGRVLTTHPAQMVNLVRASRTTPRPDVPMAIPDLRAAVARFEDLYRLGAIRQLFCEVVD